MPETTITLRLLNNDGQGLRTATIFGWDCTALAAPKTELKALLKRPELDCTGVYLLLGTDFATNTPSVYVGQAGCTRSRLNQHKDREWTQAITFVSKALNTAYARYIEGQLIQEAASVGQCVMHNSVSSNENLPDYQRAQMEEYLVRIRQLLPVLGCHIFNATQAVNAKQPEFCCRIKGLIANGRPTSGGFLILKGSEAVKQLRPSAKTRAAWIIKLRDRLINEGVLALKNDRYVFGTDYEFASSSAAAGVVRGGSAAGPRNWLAPDGRSLKEIEAAS